MGSVNVAVTYSCGDNNAVQTCLCAHRVENKYPVNVVNVKYPSAAVKETTWLSPAPIRGLRAGSIILCWTVRVDTSGLAQFVSIVPVQITMIIHTRHRCVNWHLLSSKLWAARPSNLQPRLYRCTLAQRSHYETRCELNTSAA